MCTDTANERYFSIKAIQSIAEDAILGDLVVVVLNELSDKVRATSIFFLLNDDYDHWLLAGGIADQHQIAPLSLQDAKIKGIIPSEVVQQSLSSRQLVIINDVAKDELLAADVYFNEKRNCSLLALPIIAQEQLIALIVLENRQLISAFTPECIEQLNMFAAQVGIKLQQIQQVSAIESATTHIPFSQEFPAHEDVTKKQPTLKKQQFLSTVDDSCSNTFKQFLLNSTQSENIIRLITDNAPFAVLLLDQNHQILYVNRKFTELLGYQRADIPTLAEWQRQALPQIENLEYTELAAQEFLVTCKNGIQKYIAFSFASSGVFSTIIGSEFTTRRQADLAFCASDDCFQIVFEKANVGIAIADSRGFLLKVNKRYADMLGCSSEAIIGKNSALFSHPDDLPAEIELYNQCIAGMFDEYRIEKRWVKPSGEVIWVDPLVTLTRDEQGNPQRFIGIMIDITERKKAEAALLASEDRFRQLFEKTPVPIALLAPTDLITHVNARFVETFGYSLDDIPTLIAWWDCAYPIAEARQMAMETWALAVEEAKAKGSDVKSSEYLISCKNGQIRTILISGTSVGEDLLMLFMDVTEQKQHQKKLEHIAHFDALTNLPNRVLLADRLHQSMNQARRQGQHLAVVYLDLDGFKAINDNYGHEAGDYLLLMVATRLKSALRDSDTIARLGGDEFVAVLFDVKDQTSFTLLINRLLEAANRPVINENRILKVSASLGVTFYPQVEEVNADQLLRQADQAMYQAKLMGKNRFIIFDAELDRNIRGHHESVEHIRLALIRNEFLLYYQPKVNLHTGEVIGVEALIRWQHPSNGLMTPERFLSVIEKNTLIIEIGEWVIREALQQIENWQSKGLDITISINIAALHLQQVNFVERLNHLLLLYPNVNPGNLELEILESSALEDMEYVAEVIHACHKIGVNFALDDFGTGYSSLSYLKRLPAKVLKIDRSFIRDMMDDPEDLAMLKAVLGLGAISRRQVIAEGVETVAHGEMLLQIGCILAQGYGIARPMLAEALPSWIATWHPDSVWINCSPLGREELSFLSAIVEHRAWIKAISEYFSGVCNALPYNKSSNALSSGLQIIAKKRTNKSEALQEIEFLDKQIHNLATELFMLHDSKNLSEKDIKMQALFTLSHWLDNQLQKLLKNE